MEINAIDRYKHMETALKKAGFTVDKVAKQRKKTVMSVSRRFSSKQGNGEAEKRPQ